MATLSSFIDRLPRILQEKYGSSSNALFIGWANDILETLSSITGLKTIERELGVVVDNDVWITKPSDYSVGRSLYSPKDSDREFRFEEVMKKIRIIGETFDAEDSPSTFTNISISSTTLIEVFNSPVADYAGYLLVVTSGSAVGRTIQIASTTSPFVERITFHFLHALDTAIDAADIGEVTLIAPEYFLILRYSSFFTDFAADSEEVPLMNQYEKKVFTEGLRYYAEKYRPIDMGAVGLAKSNYQEALDELIGRIETANLSGTTARNMSGLMADSALNDTDIPVPTFDA